MAHEVTTPTAGNDKTLASTAAALSHKASYIIKCVALCANAHFCLEIPKFSPPPITFH